jgi:hypothetical protein
MDSRLIFETDKTFKNKIEWVKSSKSTESEWVYLNFLQNLNKPIFFDLITEYLESDILYIVHSRRDSLEIKKENIISEIQPYLGNSDFNIWNKDFNKLIEFNKIDIYRKGIIQFPKLPFNR